MKTGKVKLDAKVYLSEPLLTTDGTLTLELLILYPNGATLNGTLHNIVSTAPYVWNASPPVCDDVRPSEYSEGCHESSDKGGLSRAASGDAWRVENL